MVELATHSDLYQHHRLRTELADIITVLTAHPPDFLAQSTSSNPRSPAHGWLLEKYKNKYTITYTSIGGKGRCPADETLP